MLVPDVPPLQINEIFLDSVNNSPNANWLETAESICVLFPEGTCLSCFFLRIWGKWCQKWQETRS